MKRILFCASTASHLRRFHLPYLRAFQEAGWEVWAASDTGESLPYADHTAAVPMVKQFFSPQNLKAISAARRLLREGGFDAVSVHTTLAAAVIRAAALTLSKRPILFSTCHGYLFSETDSTAKRLAYLLPEKLCARVTDVLMVMNEEDRRIAVKHRLSADGTVHSIPGMGVDFSRYAPLSAEQRAALRTQYGYTPEHTVFVYAAEFSGRKNHALLLHAFAQTGRDCPNARLFLAGNGALREDCIRLAGELGISVPEDVSVVGFDDVIYTKMFHPYLTTMVQPCAELGEHAIEMLHQIITTGTLENRNVILPHGFVARESTCPAPGGVRPE